MSKDTEAVLGIDAGGTKTVCLMADTHGRPVAESRGPGAALHVMSVADMTQTLADVIAQVSSSSQTNPVAICLGMAGVDRPGEPERVGGILAGILPGVRSVVVSDALIALEAGAPDQPGIVLLAGTGSMAFGRDREGRAARAGGWGYLLADEGSGYWLGRQALRAVMRAVDGRGPSTVLTRLVLEHWGVDRPRDLVQKIYAGDPRPRTIAGLAPVVEAAVDAGDIVARGIVSAGAVELAAAAMSVSTRLQLHDAPVVLAGSLFRVMPHLRSAVTMRLTEEMPQSPVRALEVEPARGAVHLAAALANNRLRLPVYVDA